MQIWIRSNQLKCGYVRMVTLLPQPYYDRVFALWEELKVQFGLRYVLDTTPLPHFTWQVSPEYELPGLYEVLEAWTSSSQPFEVRIRGLGWFSEEYATVYLRVLASTTLKRLFNELFELTQPYTAELGPFYQPENWVPHVTLASNHELSTELQPKVSAYLERNSYNWHFKATTLSLLYLEEGGPAREIKRFAFGSGCMDPVDSI